MRVDLPPAKASDLKHKASSALTVLAINALSQSSTPGPNHLIGGRRQIRSPKGSTLFDNWFFFSYLHIEMPGALIAPDWN